MQDRFTVFTQFPGEFKIPAPLVALHECGVRMFGIDRHLQTAY